MIRYLIFLPFFFMLLMGVALVFGVKALIYFSLVGFLLSIIPFLISILHRGDEKGTFESEELGSLAINSGTVLIGDNAEGKNAVHIDNLPRKLMIFGIFRKAMKSRQLVKVELRDKKLTKSMSQEAELIIDSGRLVVMDAETVGNPIIEGIVGLKDLQGVKFFPHTGKESPQGFVIIPPYGDGCYEITISRLGVSVDMLIDLEGDENVENQS